MTKEQRLANRRSALIRFHGKDSPQAVAADRAWRIARIRDVIRRYGQSLTREDLAAIIGPELTERQAVSDRVRW
jgi:hypothetical protein